MFFEKKLSLLCLSVGLALTFGNASASVLSPTQSVDSPFSTGVALVSAVDSETVIAPVLTIPAKHQGEKASVYAIGIDDMGGQYIKTKDGWDQFGGTISSYTTVTLGEKLNLNILSGDFCESAGRVFYGYSLESSPNVFHGNGMSYAVSETAKSIQAALDGIVADETTEDGKIPGVLLGLEIPGEGRLYAASGVADLTTNEPMEPHDLFRAGSITKTFTGAGILKLVDEGKLKLDDTLENLVPDLGVAHSLDIQVRHLLAHTSGVADYAFHDDWWQALMLEEDDRVFTPAELIELSNQARFGLSLSIPAESLPDVGLFEPGAVDDDGKPRVSYSNTNYGLLGMITEKVSGNMLEDELDKKLLKPLGLDNTIIPTGNEALMPEGSAMGHNNWVAQGFPLMDSPSLSIAASETCNNEVCKDELIPQPAVEASLSWAIGNVISNTEDLMDWVTALVKRKVFSYAVEEQSFGFIEGNEINDSGLGIARYYNNLIGHRGQLPGFDAVMEYDMDLDIPLVAAINRSFWGHRNVNEIVVLPIREILTAAVTANKEKLSRQVSPLPAILQQKADEYPGI